MEKPEKSEDGEEETQSCFQSRWDSCVELLVADKGHYLRHSNTLTYASVEAAEIPIKWFITATPVVNNQTNILGPARLLWQFAKWNIISETEFQNWLLTEAQNSYHSFINLDKLALDDPRRLIAMDPTRISQLSASDNVSEVARFHYYFDDLVCIRRSTASTLQIQDGSEERLSLRAMMPKHLVKTIELSWRAEEAAEFQWFHRDPARKYAAATKAWMSQGGPSKEKGDPNKFPNVTAHLRHLTLAMTSLLLAQFELIRNQQGFGGLADDINQL